MKLPHDQYPPVRIDPDVLARQALQSALDAQRLLGDSRMIRNDTDARDITEDQIADVIAAVKAYKDERNISLADIGKAVCKESSTISQILNGKYAADPRPVIKSLDQWLERRKKADAQPKTCQFVETEVAKKVLAAANIVMENADSNLDQEAGVDARIALVWGDSGCGKTLAMKAVHRRVEGSIFITCGIDVMSARGIMHKIAENLRIPISVNNGETFSAIVEQLKGTGRLIIVDEIHALLERNTETSFRTLRQLSDVTGCPQLWGATCDLVGILRTKSRRNQPMAQIVRRFGAHFHLTAKLHGGEGGSGRPQPLYTVEQILKMYSCNELKLTGGAARFLAKICTDPDSGLLGTCTKIVSNATRLYRGKATMLDVLMLWQAATVTSQPSEQARIQHLVSDELREAKAAAG